MARLATPTATQACGKSTNWQPIREKKQLILRDRLQIFFLSLLPTSLATWVRLRRKRKARRATADPFTNVSLNIADITRL